MSVGEYVSRCTLLSHSLLTHSHFSHSLPSSLPLSKLKPKHYSSPLFGFALSLVWRSFRVGLEVEDLLAPSYAWTPSSCRSVEASGLGVGKLTRFEVSGPYRTKRLHENA